MSCTLLRTVFEMNFRASEVAGEGEGEGSRLTDSVRVIRARYRI